MTGKNSVVKQSELNVLWDSRFLCFAWLT